MTRERRHDEVRRSRYEHRLDPGLAIRLDQFHRARKKMADEDALAIFLAEREQAVARDALERLEQHGVQQTAVALLRDVQARDSRGESEQVRHAPAPFADVGEREDRRMHQVQIDQRPVEIVKCRPALLGPGSLGRVAVGRFLMIVN